MISKQIYNNMKKIAIILILVLLLTTTGQTYAQTLLRPEKTASSTAAARDAIKAQTEAARMENLRKRAQTEITRRVTFLTELSGKIDKIKKLSDADKTALKAEIQTQIDGLNTLLAKINADTDLATLQADVKSIVSGYYIFAFFRVKISLLAATDRMGATADNMTTVYTKLQTRINEAQTNGQDVTELNVLLEDMLEKLNLAKTQYAEAETLLSSLTAQGYPTNRASLLQAKEKIKAGAANLKLAYQDAVGIRQELGDIKGNLRKGTFDSKNSTGSGNL